MPGLVPRLSTVRQPGFSKLSAKPEPRIQRRCRALQNNADLPASNAAHLTLAISQQVLTAIENTPAYACILATQQTEHSERKGALSRAAFANQPGNLSLPYFQLHIPQDARPVG